MNRLTLRTKRSLLWAGGGLCLAAGIGVAAWAVAVPPSVPDASRSTRQARILATRMDNSTDQLSLRSFEPLWSLDLRRPLYDPPPKQVPQTVFTPPPYPARLVGTVVEPGDAADAGMAMFATAQNKIEFKRVGETIADAQVLAVREGEVTLRYYDQEMTLAMEGRNQP